MELNRSYKLFCSMLCDIMDKDFNKSEDKFAASWQFLNHIPEIAWRPMVAMASDKWDGWPKNWVKAVKEVYELWRGGSHHSTVKYDREYDDRFPVEKMHEAYEILSSQGENAFIKFCNSESMPLSDRDRVMTKLRVVTGEMKIDILGIKERIGNVTGSNKTLNRIARIEVLTRQKNEILQREPGWEPECEVPF